jgi:SAM-dependent methyltransferase
MNDNWQLKIFRKSLKKKQRVAKLIPYLGLLEQKRCLEIGCARGVIGFHLRQQGGRWTSVDTDLINLHAARQLLGKGVLLADPVRLPFPDGSFDLIATLDILEHLEDDDKCLDEIARLLASGGLLLLSAPTTGRMFLVNRLKNMIGLTPDVYGHVREGYDPDVLADRLRIKGFQVMTVVTFTRFFTELLEAIINFGYIFFGRTSPVQGKRDGFISPTSEAELRKNMKVFRLYSMIYPLAWLFSRLDHLLVGVKGYTVLISARKQ